MTKFFSRLWSIVIFACVYYGFVEGVEGARNVAMFWYWSMFVLILVFTAIVIAYIEKTQPPKANKFSWWLTFTSFSVIGVMVWHGAVFTPSAVLFTWLLVQLMRVKLNERFLEIQLQGTSP